MVDEFILDEQNEYFWTQLSDKDYAYHTQGPRLFPPACVWCGGRHKHNPLCFVELDYQAYTFPGGKWKGRRLCDPSLNPKKLADYLEWRLSHKWCVGIEAENYRRRLRELEVEL